MGQVLHSPSASADVAADSTLCLGVTWPGRAPHLALSPTPSGPDPILVPLLGNRVGLRTLAPHRFCLGRLALDGPVKGRVACPFQATVPTGAQCEDCAARDGFRFAHQVHRGGHVPPALARYMAQRHWVYVATFADGTSKVGTAAAARKVERLDEQGAVRATYVAHVPDGAVARVFEDAVTAAAGLAQAKRSAAKTAALAGALPTPELATAHADAVARAHTALSGEATTPGVELPAEQWRPPTAAHAAFEDRPGPGWPLYPHSLRTGEHGLTVLGACGSAALVRVSDDDDTCYVVDLSALKGRRVALGDFCSPPTQFQPALF